MGHHSTAENPTPWYCRIQQQVIGPLSAAQLREMSANHILQPADEVRHGATGGWVAARHVKGLFRVANQDAPPATEAEGGASRRPSPKDTQGVRRQPRVSATETASTSSTAKWIVSAGVIGVLLIAGICFASLFLFVGSLTPRPSTQGDASASVVTAEDSQQQAISHDPGEMENVEDGDVPPRKETLPDLVSSDSSSGRIEPSEGSELVSLEHHRHDRLDDESAPPDDCSSDAAGDVNLLLSAKEKRAKLQQVGVEQALQVLEKKYELRQKQLAEKIALQEQMQRIRADDKKFQLFIDAAPGARHNLIQQAAQLQQRRQAILLLNGPLDPQLRIIKQQLRQIDLLLVQHDLNVVNANKSRIGLSKDAKDCQLRLAECQRRENDLNFNWLEDTDAYGLQSSDYQRQLIAKADLWIAGDSDFMVGYLARGFARIHVGAMEQALSDFEYVETSWHSVGSRLKEQKRRATKLEIDQEIYLTALSGKGKTLMEMDDDEQAEEVLGQALGMGRLPLAYVLRGLLYVKMGNRAAAANDFERAMRLDCPAAYREAARNELQRSASIPNRALKFAEKACEQTGYDDWSSLEVYGMALQLAGESDAAKKWFQKALELAPLDHYDRIHGQLASLP